MGIDVLMYEYRSTNIRNKSKSSSFKGEGLKVFPLSNMKGTNVAPRSTSEGSKQFILPRTECVDTLD